jgi:hypothetical protein
MALARGAPFHSQLRIGRPLDEASLPPAFESGGWLSPSNQSVRNGQFRKRQIIHAAMIEGSARKCRAERAEQRPALRAPVIPRTEWLGPFSA